MIKREMRESASEEYVSAIEEPTPKDSKEKRANRQNDSQSQSQGIKYRYP